MNRDDPRQDSLLSGASNSDGDSDAKDSPDKWLLRVIDEHERQLVRYALHFVGEPERARDVVQDVFMKLCHEQRIRGTQGPLAGTQLAKWLYTVCRNRAIDVARKENRMKSASTNQIDEQLTTESRSPEAAMLAEEQQRTLLDQIKLLPRNQQEVLRLKFHGGLSYQQIAEVTGLTKSNVGFLLHTAISRLRQRVTTD